MISKIVTLGFVVFLGVLLSAPANACSFCKIKNGGQTSPSASNSSSSTSSSYSKSSGGLGSEKIKGASKAGSSLSDSASFFSSIGKKEAAPKPEDWRNRQPSQVSVVGNLYE